MRSMTANIIDGKAIAAEVRQGIQEKVAARVAAGGRRPGLAVVLVGENPASEIYVRNKHRACEEVGFVSRGYRRHARITQYELLELVDDLNADPAIDGILVQLPLPAHIDPQAVIEHIDPRKDVDGFHPVNLGALALNLPGLRPCTPHGCMTLLQHTDVSLAGKHAVVVGRSNIVGRPMALELLNADCTVTLCHSRTQNLAEEVSRADILVAAIGRAEFVRGEWVRPGAVVIDVGMNRTDAGLRGDVEFAAASARASWITPVPGGVGPMTIATLLANTLQVAELSDPR